MNVIKEVEHIKISLVRYTLNHIFRSEHFPLQRGRQEL